MDPGDFRLTLCEIIDLLATFIESKDNGFVVPDLEPGEVLNSIPVSPPEVIVSV